MTARSNADANLRRRCLSVVMASSPGRDAKTAEQLAMSEDLFAAVSADPHLLIEVESVIQAYAMKSVGEALTDARMRLAYIRSGVTSRESLQNGTRGMNEHPEVGRQLAVQNELLQRIADQLGEFPKTLVSILGMHAVLTESKGISLPFSTAPIDERAVIYARLMQSVGDDWASAKNLGAAEPPAAPAPQDHQLLRSADAASELSRQSPECAPRSSEV